MNREAVSVLLPYPTTYDDVSWWYSQLLVIYKSYMLYRRNILEYYEVVTWNQDHSDYPKEAKFSEVVRYKMMN